MEIELRIDQLLFIKGLQKMKKSSPGCYTQQKTVPAKGVHRVTWHTCMQEIIQKFNEHDWVRMVVNIRKGYHSSLFGAESKENNIDKENLSSWSDNTKETTKEDFLPNTSFITQTYSYHIQRKYFPCFFSATVGSLVFNIQGLKLTC